MANKLYKLPLAIVTGLILATGAIAQEPAKATPPAASSAPSAAEVSELRAKRMELQNQLQDINRKLMSESRKEMTGRVNRDSIRLKAMNEVRAYRMDTAWVKSLKSLKGFKMDSSLVKRLQMNGNLAAGGFAKDMDAFSKRMGEMGERMGKAFDNKNFNFDNFSKAFNDPDYKGIEKSKTISKSYPAGANDKLAINNQYGKVTINTWTKNEIKVDVEIKAYDGSDDKAQKLLDGVKVEDTKSNNLVSFKTTIDRDNASGGWWTRSINGVETRRGVQVNYVVYMPAKSSVDISNTYGAVILPDLDGIVKATVAYGSLTAGKLSNPSNELKISYSPVTIESLLSGTLDTQYGKVDIGTADHPNLQLSYSSGSRIGHLINGGDLNLKYSTGFKIDQLDSRFKNVNVTSSFSPGLSINAGSGNFDFDVSVSYANFDYNNKVSIQSKEPSDNSGSYSNTKTYKGQYGKGSDAKVVIRSNYGSVKFL